MHRCFELALRGQGRVAPNPLVGAVLVYEDRIIGEGWHEQYGAAHAEVNCINSVLEADRVLIANCTLYVSLEPCAHFGKTPPCTDLIIRNRIPQVVIGCQDPFSQVNGKGIAQLEAAGIQVWFSSLQEEAKQINRRFFTSQLKQRPYITLKWAQTANGIIGLHDNRLLISDELSNRLVHRWRSEESAILVGFNTALNDNPRLDNRFWYGVSPVRMVVDPQNKLPGNLNIFDGTNTTWILNQEKENRTGMVQHLKYNNQVNEVTAILETLYLNRIQSVLVEGGRATLQKFIDAGLWDEARIIINPGKETDSGIAAPVLKNQVFVNGETSGDCLIHYYKKSN
jgi:diaminohydroxyphosphoribosylaminopyrimidine deaminase / 5-amino-6-(5-phosphoribosylamino)uracil reductase